MGRGSVIALVRGVLVAAAVLCTLIAPATAARAQGPCVRSVVYALPSVTWGDVAAARPPALLRAIDQGSSGTMSVRTNSSRTSLASGFATIGGGARVDGGQSTGGPVSVGADGTDGSAEAAGVQEVLRLAAREGYGAAPGALAASLESPVVALGNGDLGIPPPAPVGYGRWTLLAAMDRAGRVDVAATSTDLLRRDPDAPYGVRTDPGPFAAALDDALALDCSTVIVDHGDLTRADQWAMATGRDFPQHRTTPALIAADEGLAAVMERLDFERDLLLVVSPTSPSWASEAHLGIAVAVGPGFEPRSSLQSASTRRPGLVTLPDVAPTLLEHRGVTRPAVMNGRPFVDAGRRQGDVIRSGINLDEESVFIDGVKGPINVGFVAFQVIVYALILALLVTRERRGGVDPRLARILQIAGLAVVAFPVSTYLAGVVQGHELGPVWFTVILVAIAAALTAVISLSLRNPLDRLMALTAFTLGVIALDLATGSRLQLNTVLGYSPIVAGRFAGAGNIVFAVLGVAALLTGTLMAHRAGGSAVSLAVVAFVFGLAVIVDGAPQMGSDVGGVLALVPALAVTWLLLSGRKPSPRTIAVALIGGVVVLGLFLAVDLSRPPESQTHLARMFDDVRQRGPDVFVETVRRKAAANLRVFTSTIYTYFVPPALLVMAYLLRRPSGRWQRFAVNYPLLRAGLIGGLVLAVLGFAVNDSGIVIPAVILSFLVPMALLVHLRMDAEMRAANERTA